MSEQSPLQRAAEALTTTKHSEYDIPAGIDVMLLLHAIDRGRDPDEVRREYVQGSDDVDVGETE